MTKTCFQEGLGQRIAVLRKERGLSQVKFAYLMEMEKQNINRLEKGKTNPTAFTLYKIAEVMEIPVSKLFDFLH
jgi:transcriptional regulator with XRE-family HTH domain